jgi:hypothetical protein
VAVLTHGTYVNRVLNATLEVLKNTYEEKILPVRLLGVNGVDFLIKVFIEGLVEVQHVVPNNLLSHVVKEDIWVQQCHVIFF